LASGVSGLGFAGVPGPVFSTGDNSNGQLGDGGTVERASFGPVSGAGLGGFVALSAGGAFSLGLRSDGTVWGWGQNDLGELGDGSVVDAHAPVQVPVPSGMVGVAAGGAGGLAVRSDGTVWAWGENNAGQLGIGSDTGPDSCRSAAGISVACSLLPVQVSGLSGVVAVAAGGSSSYALRSDGTVWEWGGNGTTPDSDVPVQVSGISGVVAIAGGAFHALALESNGTVWAWGYNGVGELGDGSTTDSDVPVRVTGLLRAVAIAAGQQHSLALLANGTVQAWGFNDDGQLGNGTTTEENSSVPVAGISNVTEITAGEDHSAAVESNGTVWAWGQGADGGGGGSSGDEDSPVQATSVGNGAEQVVSGSSAEHTLLIGQPYATLSPATGPIAFTSPGGGFSSTSQVETVSDTGIVPLQFGQASITGADGDEFVITGDGCSNTTIKPGASCQIGLRYNEKVNESSPVATLRIPSDSPTSPDTITLDPPAVRQPAARTAAVACSTRRAHRTLTVTCALASALKHARRQLKARLARGRHTAATATSHKTTARKVTLHLKLPRKLKAGNYTLTITTTNPATKTNQSLRL